MRLRRDSCCLSGAEHTYSPLPLGSPARDPAEEHDRAFAERILDYGALWELGWLELEPERRTESRLKLVG